MLADRPDPADLAALYRRARAAGHAAEPALLLHDLARLRARLAALAAAFPPATLHTLAIKANPLVGVLRTAVAAGAGLEAASIEEVYLALRAGCPPDRIVFDSPAKTTGELADALRRGIRVNADNFAELDRIAALRADIPTTSAIGLRVNPELAEPALATTSVGHRGSRFGVPLSGRAQIRAAFARHPFLRGLHLHIGSQAVTIPELVEGVARVWDLSKELGFEGHVQIDTFDLGGGLPAVYRDDAPRPTHAAYAVALRAALPDLFTADLRLVTEFGRSLLADCGAAVSRVEVTKPGPVAVLHFGADLFVRRVYRPHEWHHDFLVLDPAGHLKSGPTVPTTLAGPLCFGGDILARDLPLPAIEPGDHVLVRDTGAYTLSMWSRYCSRAIPLVLGLDDDAVTVLRPRDSLADVVAFWGG